MTTFDERERSFEARYRNNQEKMFRIVSRRNRLLGEWAAERFGLTGSDAQEYAKEVVFSDFEEPGDADVVRKVLGDFSSRGIDMDETRLRAEMSRLLDKAEEQMNSEG